jgi:hypothetical protein
MGVCCKKYHFTTETKYCLKEYIAARQDADRQEKDNALFKEGDGA